MGVLGTRVEEGHREGVSVPEPHLEALGEAVGEGVVEEDLEGEEQAVGERLMVEEAVPEGLRVPLEDTEGVREVEPLREIGKAHV